MTKRQRKWWYVWELLRSWGRMPKAAQVPIDILFPVCEKDLATLPLALEGARRQVQHPIAAIYIIAAPSPLIEQFCCEHDCRFVDETSVLGYDARALHVKLKTNGRDRSGWIFQQLLKLSGRVGRATISSRSTRITSCFDRTPSSRRIVARSSTEVVSVTPPITPIWSV